MEVSSPLTTESFTSYASAFPSFFTVTEIVVGQYKGELILLDPRAENGEAGVSGASSSGWDSTPDAEPPADAFSDEIPF